MDRISEKRRFTAPETGGVPTLGALSDKFRDCYDFETRTVFLGGDKNKRADVCFIDGLVSGRDIAELVIKPLTDRRRFGGILSEKEITERISGGMVYGYSVKTRYLINDAVNDLLNGFCAVLIGKTAVTFEMKSSDKRSVSEPAEEKVLRALAVSYADQVPCGRSRSADQIAEGLNASDLEKFAVRKRKKRV